MFANVASLSTSRDINYMCFLSRKSEKNIRRIPKEYYALVGLDMIFLERGIQLASRSVYSLHKTSTREHVLKKAEGWGAKPQGICTELFVLSLK